MYNARTTQEQKSTKVQTLRQQERVDYSMPRVNGPTRARATVSTSIDSSDLKKSEQVQTLRDSPRARENFNYSSQMKERRFEHGVRVLSSCLV